MQLNLCFSGHKTVLTRRSHAGRPHAQHVVEVYSQPDRQHVNIPNPGNLHNTTTTI